MFGKRNPWLLAGALLLAMGASGCGGSPAGDALSSEETLEEAEAAAPVSSVSSGLSVMLSSADGRGHAVRFALVNATAGAVHVFRDQIPIDGLTGRLFDVELDGEPVPYLGIETSRPSADPASAPEQFVVLGLGKSLTAEVDLADYYDMSAPGTYVVRFIKAPSAVVWELRESGVGTASSPVFDANEPVEFVELAGVPLRAKPGADAGLEADASAVGAYATTQNCSSSQAANLETAQTAARKRSWNAYHYLNDHRNSNGTWTWTTRNTRYTWWYGYNLNHKANNYDNQLLDHWVHMARSLNGGYSDSPSPRFRCQPSSDQYCRKGHIAYTYPADSAKNVYLCPSFWSYPADSQRNIVIHEVAHFNWNSVEGARDIEYGANKSHALPPHDRYYNADNFLFFAIDTTRT